MHPDGKSLLPYAEPSLIWPLLNMCIQPCSTPHLRCSPAGIRFNLLTALCASVTLWHSAVFMFKFIDLSAYAFTVKLRHHSEQLLLHYDVKCSLYMETLLDIFHYRHNKT